MDLNFIMNKSDTRNHGFQRISSLNETRNYFTSSRKINLYQSFIQSNKKYINSKFNETIKFGEKKSLNSSINVLNGNLAFLSNF